MSQATVRTPAKLNLGLEITGRRPDGYHELVTVFQAIDLYDQLIATTSSGFEYVGDPRIPVSDDIARPILEAAARKHGWTGRLELRKSIPIAAGLGGGSSDAALALKIATFDQPASEIRSQAASIGADVPFFIEGGTALATGIGERLEALQTPQLWFILVTPRIDIPSKTVSLFQGLTPADFSSGDDVRALAREISARGGQAPEELPNAFQRQMLDFPAVHRVWQELRDVAGRVALTGAGPTLFSWHTSQDEACGVAERIGSRTDWVVHVASAIGPQDDTAKIHAIRALLEGSGATD